MSEVIELGYIGLSISDLSAWKAYASELIGMEFRDEGEGDRVYLRMDEWHHRIVLHTGGNDDLAYIGLRVSGPQAFRAMAEKLSKVGIEFRMGTEEDAAERRVMGLLKTTDPAGNQVEIFWGPRVDRHEPFHPGRPMHGRFVTGTQGLGHVVLHMPDAEAGIRFYETLGFCGAIEYHLPTPGGPMLKPVFMRVNERQHSLAFIPAPGSKRLNHLMFEYTNLKDLGMSHDRVKAQKIPTVMELGMHSNDEMLSFYTVTPSGFACELGWGAGEAGEHQEYHVRDIFGHGMGDVTPEGLNVKLD